MLSDVPVAPSAPIERRARTHETRGETRDVEPCGRASVLAGAICGAEREQRAGCFARCSAASRTPAASPPVSTRLFSAPASVRVCSRSRLPSRAASAIVHDLTAGMVDRQGRRSLGYNVEQTVRVAGAVRDRLSTDNWRVLNRLLQLSRANRRCSTWTTRSS